MTRPRTENSDSPGAGRSAGSNPEGRGPSPERKGNRPPVGDRLSGAGDQPVKDRFLPLLEGG